MARPSGQVYNTQQTWKKSDDGFRTSGDGVVEDGVDCPVQWSGRREGAVVRGCHMHVVLREASVTVTLRLFFPLGHHLPPTPASLSSFLLALPFSMSHDNEELIDYEDDIVTNSAGASTVTRVGDDGDKGKKDFSGIHATGFR